MVLYLSGFAWMLLWDLGGPDHLQEGNGLETCANRIKFYIKSHISMGRILRHERNFALSHIAGQSLCVVHLFPAPSVLDRRVAGILRMGLPCLVAFIPVRILVHQSRETFDCPESHGN